MWEFILLGLGLIVRIFLLLNIEKLFFILSVNNL